MYHLRYGHPELKEYYPSFILGFILIAMGAISFYVRNYYGAVLLCGGVIGFIIIFLPYCESYRIENRTITIKKWGKISQCTIPQNPVIVISKAAIPELFRYRTFPLHRRYELTMISGLSLSEVCQRLSDCIPSRYGDPCGSYIANHIPSWCYIYSVTFEKEQLQWILEQISDEVILPKNLVPNGMQHIPGNIFIDESLNLWPFS